MIFCVTMYFNNLVLYIRTESDCFVVRSCDDGMVTCLNLSSRNNLSRMSN